MLNVVGLLKSCCVAVALTLCVTTIAQGQSTWLSPREGNSVSFEFYKAKFAADRQTDFMTSTWFLSGRFRAKRSVSVEIELPISNYSPDNGADGELGFGNPYYGVTFRDMTSPTRVEFGVRLPVYSEEKYTAAFYGWYADFDRWTAFLPNLLTFRARVGGRFYSAEGNLVTTFKFGGYVMVPTDGGDAEVIGEVLGDLWFRTQPVWFGLTLSASNLFTESRLDFGERSEVTVGLGVAADVGQARPGLNLQLPVLNDGFIDRGEVVDYVIGFNLTISFPGSSDQP